MAQVRFKTAPVKDPDEKKDYSLVWVKELRKDKDTIASSVWVLDAGITQSSSPAPTNDIETTTIWLEGGTAGTDYTVRNRITTTRGRIHEGSFVVPVKAS
jgi:hypothetical protein